MKERVGYLGRCHSHAWFEPWLPGSVPQGLRLSCNCHASSPVYHATCKQKTKRVCKLAGSNIWLFFLYQIIHLWAPPPKKSLKTTIDTATRGVRDWNSLRMLHTNIRNVGKGLFGERTLWEPTSSLSQVRIHLTFMNIRRAVCASLVPINGYIMSPNKRAFLWREEPTWGGKSTSSGTERAGLWMPIWRRKDEGNATHTPLRHSMTSDFIH